MSLRILICEDEGLTRLWLTRTLQQLGHQVVGVARTGLQAVSAAAELHPEVILMDVEMPELDGVAALQRILNYRPTAVVMLTAYADPICIETAEKAGACGYLVKPVLKGQVREAVVDAVKRFAAQSGTGTIAPHGREMSDENTEIP